MNREQILQKVHDSGILPVIALNDIENALPLARACLESGLNAIEITYRTDCAGQALRQIKEACPELLLGAGTVLTAAQAKEAMDIGVDFIVTPGFNREVVEYVLSHGFPIVPGVSSASEIEQGLALGLDTLKFFPAEQSGGVGALKAFAGPYRKLSFVPTGGLTFDNFTSYTSLDNVTAIGGSFMIDKKHIAQNDVEAMKEDIRKVVDRLLGLELSHVGINCENEKEALDSAKLLSSFLHMPYREGNSSIFSGNREFELMKHPGRGRNGHIAIATGDIDRAVNYLEKRGDLRIRLPSGEEVRLS